MIVAVNENAIGMFLEGEEENTLHILTLDEAENLAMELGHHVQDLRMQQYAEETTHGTQP